MKVLVVGATGTVGRKAVERMLAEGHDVTAFARRPGKLGLRAANLKLWAGDATNASAVSEAVAGHDAVVVTLGAGLRRSGTIRSEGTMNVIQAMQNHGVRRLICQSTLGAHESWSNLNFFWKRIMFGLLLRPVFQDHELQEKLVRASGLDWTIVRPSAFRDGPATGQFREGFGPMERLASLTITRGDIAEFLNRQLSETRYLRNAVGIST